MFLFCERILIGRVNDAVHWYMGELSARVVAESGRACDRFHLGKLILQGLRDAPDFISQINGATGESETSGSVMERSIRCALAMSAMGLCRGDVIVLMAPNHLDLCIPYYAALYLGVTIAPIDRYLGIKELENVFSIDEPKLVFCQSAKAQDVRTALKNCKLVSKVVTFDEEENKTEGSVSFKEMMDKYGSNSDVEQYKPSDFDPEDTIAVLVSTSGTTGLPKQISVTHKNFVAGGHIIDGGLTDCKFPSPTRMAFLVSSLQWGSAIFHINNSPVFRYTRLQTSKDIDQQHAYDLINTYKPTNMTISPTMMATLLKSSRGRCDLTCFEFIIIGGAAVAQALLDEIAELAPNTFAVNGYGISEISSAAFVWDPIPVPGSSGKPCGHFQYRLVDTDTGRDIIKPNASGELWLKGPSITTKGYYKNPEATKQAFTEGGWFKTGDMFYRDEHWNFFFVERIKMLLKYKNHQVSPAEIQNLIRSHPGVQDVVVLGIPDFECGDLPVACVIKRPETTVTAQEIKDLVKENLTDTKRLRGGVMFFEVFPLMAGGKVNYKKLKEIVINLHSTKDV